jgi:hypothetical protein
MSFSIWRSVPIRMSPGWSGTLVRHLPQGEAKNLCDPFWRSSTQPSRFSFRMTSRLVTPYRLAPGASPSTFG